MESGNVENQNILKQRREKINRISKIDYYIKPNTCVGKIE